MVTKEEFEKEFSECVYNIKRIHLHNGDSIIADDYEEDGDNIVLILGYHRIAYVHPHNVKVVCGID